VDRRAAASRHSDCLCFWSTYLERKDHASELDIVQVRLELGVVFGNLIQSLEANGLVALIGLFRGCPVGSDNVVEAIDSDRTGHACFSSRDILGGFQNC